ncbi:MAG: anthranilate phosphoribosyltransferase [Elusimicrobia bacterium]|nr:anthranilate phosphoribosyltransferase [Candidatus Liberimonas magnetica]
MIKEAIAKVVLKQDLTEQESGSVMAEIMTGEATESQIASLITALRMKGETVDEITGFARVMRKFATPIRVRATVDIDREDINIDTETIIDTCGTGGDRTNTFNISTATALVISACGLSVAKHGNRSVSSACGSADVLETLGVNLDVKPEKVEECIAKIGIGFLFAPSLHGSMKYAIGPRRQIGIRTVFNILGPLTNPAGANAQVLGVYSQELVELLANVLNKLGTKKAWIVHGKDGLDEITTTDSTKVAELNLGRVKVFAIAPEEFGLKRAKMEDIRGGNKEENARIITDILSGIKGPKRDIVLFNAGACLFVADNVKGLKEGIKKAEAAIDSGKAKEKLVSLIKITNEPSPS